jgi:hypothetical protein
MAAACSGAVPSTRSGVSSSERNPFEYIHALSDIAGIDIKHHGAKPVQMVHEVRNWFVETVGIKGARSATVVWYEFTEFMADFYEKREAEGFARQDLDMMPVPEFIDFVREWVGQRDAR